MKERDTMRYFNIALSASLMLLLCILSVPPTLAAGDTFEPYKVAPGPDGNVYAYASNNGVSHIFVFAPDGMLAKTLDRNIRDLASDDAGNLYVLDMTAWEIRPVIFNITRLDMSGNETVLWSNVNESYRDVIDMAVAPGGVVYFSNVFADPDQSAQTGISSINRCEIDAIDTNGTLRVVLVKNVTSMSDCFHVLTVDRNGTIYATMGAVNRVTVISPDGTMETIGKLGSENGMFNWIYDVVIGRDGYLYVAESGNRRVQKLTTDGSFVARWSGCGPDPFIGHCRLAIDENGRIYVADYDNRRIVWFTPDYTYGADENENLKGQGVTWGTVYAGTNYTTQLLERKFEELQNDEEAIPVPGFAAFVALIGIGLGTAFCFLRK